MELLKRFVFQHLKIIKFDQNKRILGQIEWNDRVPNILKRDQQLLNQSITYNVLCRTSPATPDLLNIHTNYTMIFCYVM